MREFLRIVALCAAAAALPACNGSSSSGDAGGGSTAPGDGSDAVGRVFTIEPGDNTTDEALAAFFQAGPGDTIEFGCGFFEFSTGLVMQGTENVVITGCGRDETVLSFRDSDTAEGFLAINVRGLVVEDLTVADTPGDGIKIKGGDFVTYRDARVIWSSADRPITAENYQTAMQFECPASPHAQPTYQPSSSNGRYGIYPVQSRNVLIDNVESIGASDAGLYVGQSDDVIMRNSRAAYNVAGFEIENTRGADMYGNLGECNTVGYIVYDLPELSQYGRITRMYDNVARNNNNENFAAGGIVSQVPSGSGLITLAYDQIEVFDNTFEDHRTGSIIITSYELIGMPNDRRMDVYDEALHIHDNVFRDGGYNPPLPDIEQVVLGDDISTLLPTLVRLKNGGFGAHIVWDGLYDELDGDCPYPENAEGEDAPADERGKPELKGGDPNPDCRYNAYKFDAQGQRKRPEMFICIENNSFSQTLEPLVPNYVNFHGLEGLEPVLGLVDGLGDPQSLLQDPLGVLTGTVEGIPGLLDALTPDRDMGPHNCQARYGRTLPPLPETTIPEYQPPDDIGERPSEEEILAVCEQDSGDAINREALAYDCPRLAHYNLFTDPGDPRSTPRGGGVPFDLNTQLFSDYAVKYRVAFLPPGGNGKFEPAQYKDAQDGANESYRFPLGTVIAKTFAFPDDSAGTEDVVETRLLIKREGHNGQPIWTGLAYIWETAADGTRVAKLSYGGGTAAVSWHYQDENTGQLYQGSTESYAIPHANQCLTCHANDDRTAGSAPIGPKPRNLNKPYDYDGDGSVNQIKYWRDRGMLVGGPADLAIDGSGVATAVERHPVFNQPGDSGHGAGSDADVEARVRAYLEVNCQHCHNPRGVASNTGLYLDSVREVDTSYGICKTPTAAGSGSGGYDYDIEPGSANTSILTFRMGSNDPEAKMPTISRSVVHAEGLNLVRGWIDQVVDDSYEGAEQCGSSGGLPF